MKTNFKKKLLTLAMLAGSATMTYAQFTVDGQVISRGEYRHGYSALADSASMPGAFVDQRTRIAFGYKNDNFKVGVSFQDVRTWGSTKQLNSVDGFTSMHEGWVEWMCCKKGSIKAGRQELNYDNARMFGNVDWTMQARSHDIALLKLTPDTMTQIHIGIAWNQDMAQNASTYYNLGNSTNSFGNYKAMQLLWANRRIGNSMNVSLLAFNQGLQYDWVNDSGAALKKVVFSQTVGTNFNYKKDAIACNFNAYYQMGDDARYKMRDGQTPKTLGAYEAMLDFAYTLQKKFVFTVGGEILSGNDKTDTTKAYNDVNHAFNPFYGTNHKFNGYMDYFYVGNHANNVGLINPYFKFKYAAEKYWAQLDYHYFMAAAPVLDVAKTAQTGNITAMGSALGSELDLTFAYNVTKQASVQFGYSMILGPTDTMKALKGGNVNANSNWAYLMFSFKPALFKQ